MNLLSALSVSASGMSAQRERTELLVENLANSDTTRTPEGGPYRRKDVVFAADPSATEFSSLFESQMNGERHWGSRRPSGDGHARAGEALSAGPSGRGCGRLRRLSAMNPAEDMVDLLSASRGYQANVSAISAVKDMIQKSLELFR